ncbi:flagellin, partial [Planosporangium flavigriseum]|nr:flagellin [Planosporangium flavigriseum]
SSAILQRMRSLAVQAANTGSQDSSAQAAADTEFQQLKSELTRITTATKFGSQALLGGSYNGAFQVDSATGTGTQLAVNLSSANISTITAGGISGLDATGLGLGATTVALTSG